MLKLDPTSTALVLIDLQAGIVAMPLEPRSAAEVVATSTAMAKRFREKGAPVVLVRVEFSADFKDAPRSVTDEPMRAQLTPGWSALVPELQQPGDVIVTKRQWGAFYGTDLEVQLRRRGVRTIVLGGVATNFGVESTARWAWELGFDVVLAEDACASRSAELHAFPLKYVFPRIARVTTSSAIELG